MDTEIQPFADTHEPETVKKSKRQWLNKLTKNPRLIFVLIFALFGCIALLAVFAQSPTQTSTHTVIVEGELEILHGDNFKGKKSTEKYTLISPSGERTPLDIASGEVADYMGQARVRVKGTIKNGRVQAKSATDIKLLQVTTPPETPHKTAVILFNFSDNKNQPVAASTVKSTVFTDPKSANAFFKEESFGQRSLIGINDPAGDIFGYYTIPLALSQGCNENDWADAANAAATADGHDITQYDNIIYIPGASNCEIGVIGQAQIGGSRSWIFTYDSLMKGTIEHELTHNFGTGHANAIDCWTDGSYSATALISDSNYCIPVEYGDPYDVMGGGSSSIHTFHSNNYFLYELGWIPKGQVKTVTQSGDYTITPPETNTSGTKAIRLIHSIDTSNNIQYLYLEYRQPKGFDDFNASEDPVTGVTVRLSSGSNGTIRSYILQTYLDPNNYNSYSIHDGKSFTDAGHNITIKQLSHDTNKAVVHIDVRNVPQIDKTAPSIPTNLQSPDTSTRFVTLTWKPSPETDTSYYKVFKNGHLLGSAFPDQNYPGVVTFINKGNFTPGTTATYTVKAIDGAGNVSDASQALNVVIPPKDTSPPSIPTNLTGFLDGKAGTIPNLSWTVSTDNKKVYGYIVVRTDNSGNVARFDTRLYNPDGTVPNFWDWSYEVGKTYTYRVKAYDGDLNYSALSNRVKL